MRSMTPHRYTFHSHVTDFVDKKNDVHLYTEGVLDAKKRKGWASVKMHDRQCIIYKPCKAILFDAGLVFFAPNLFASKKRIVWCKE